jgi:hypothetical protein
MLFFAANLTLATMSLALEALTEYATRLPMGHGWSGASNGLHTPSCPNGAITDEGDWTLEESSEVRMPQTRISPCRAEMNEALEWERLTE